MAQEFHTKTQMPWVVDHVKENQMPEIVTVSMQEQKTARKKRNKQSWRLPQDKVNQE